MSELSLRGHPASSGVGLGPAWSRRATGASPLATPAEEQDKVRRGLDAAVAELSALVRRLRDAGHAADAEIVEALRDVHRRR